VNYIATLRHVAAISAIAALAACGGGGSHAAIPPAASSGTPVGGNSGAAPTSKTTLALHASKAFAASTTLVGPATTINTVVMHVVPNLQNAAGLTQYAQQVSDPSNGLYRHFLAPSDIASRFGASSADYAAVASYFASYGLKVGGWTQRLALTVAGPRQSFEKALGTTMGFYRGKNGETLLAPQGTVAFSKAIPVAEISDAVLDTRAHWVNAVKSSGTLTQSLSGYGPGQISTGFDYTSAYNAGYTGKGITIGIVGTGPAMALDFNTYKSQYAFGGSSALTFPPVTAAAAAAVGNSGAVNAGGSPTATPPPVTAPCGGPNASTMPTPSCNPEDGEAQIDTEQAALAKDATIAFYLAYVPIECFTPNAATCTPDPATGLGGAYQGLAEADDEIQQMIADNTVDIVSGSYGGPETFQETGYLVDDTGAYDPSGLGPAEFAALAAEGISTFFSSGDQGAQGCSAFLSSLSLQVLQCVSYPASDVSLTAVGGVTIPLSNAGTLLGPITAWGEQTFTAGFGGASGGGASCLVPQPAWQKQPSYESGSLSPASSECQFLDVSGGRILPDVSLLGDPETGVGVVGNVKFGTGSQAAFGGTSVATPQMAAMWALVLQACAQTTTCAKATGAKAYRLGNAAPLFWQIYSNQALYSSTIYDVTFGNNGINTCTVQLSCPSAQPAPGYNAGAGWDAATGLGAPFARHLITAVVGV
jgi:subtilase family serine protease